MKDTTKQVIGRRTGMADIQMLEVLLTLYSHFEKAEAFRDQEVHSRYGTLIVELVGRIHSGEDNPGFFFHGVPSEERKKYLLNTLETPEYQAWEMNWARLPH